MAVIRDLCVTARLWGASLVFIAAVACAPTPAGSEAAAPVGASAADTDVDAGTAGAATSAPSGAKRPLKAYRKVSCPAGVDRQDPSDTPFEMAPVPGKGVDFSALTGVRLNGLRFVAGYSLSSAAREFGGLSGLDSIDDDTLLAVSDKGYFFWIDLDQDTLERPVAIRMATILDAQGRPFREKRAADAEGLAVVDGAALVSFEQDHRISLFDLADCGAAAREALVTELDLKRALGSDVGDNSGPEALALAPDNGFIIGVETKVDGRSPVSFAPSREAYDFSLSLPAISNKSLTGADFLPSSDSAGDLYTVHRDFDVLRGPRISILRTPASRDDKGVWSLGDSTELMALSLPAPVDNFEGLTVTRAPEGGLRLFLVSDDNYSTAQRTLFFVFDVLET